MPRFGCCNAAEKCSTESATDKDARPTNDLPSHSGTENMERFGKDKASLGLGKPRDSWAVQCYASAHVPACGNASPKGNVGGNHVRIGATAMGFAWRSWDG